ncbi:hypothetical protein ROG8370_00412 [Roseovarius gaetbuli]|uniref:Uncharacterized protein n=1 Tax=Roseovarius gaetbuli TaxID=1356575 RepID=A0A1X6YB11_9RHOB|nr:hypothetical protein [Roseovarius gaetbuli]SLN15411.1 hypothetical protein ROG8370_00412 [Roseovarius gaetbuli]
MTLTSLAIALSGAGVLVTGTLAALFLRDPVAGMAAAQHRADKLPEVMADRFVGMGVLALAATLYGDLKVIAVLFAVFAYTGFHDAWIYARGGFATGTHLAAGFAGAFVSVVAMVAMMGQG